MDGDLFFSLGKISLKAKGTEILLQPLRLPANEDYFENRGDLCVAPFVSDIYELANGLFTSVR